MLQKYQDILEDIKKEAAIATKLDTTERFLLVDGL